MYLFFYALVVTVFKTRSAVCKGVYDTQTSLYAVKTFKHNALAISAIASIFAARIAVKHSMLIVTKNKTNTTTCVQQCHKRITYSV